MGIRNTHGSLLDDPHISPGNSWVVTGFYRWMVLTDPLQTRNPDLLHSRQELAFITEL